MRAIGIVRVSKTDGRSGDSFISPEAQRQRIEDACRSHGWTLVEVHEELDVSGGKALERRPGLSAAVRAIEDGSASVVVGGYFDRLFRSLSTQAEVVSRVERAGGQVFAVDMGQVSEASAGQWLTGGMLGLVSEYFRRSVTEKSNEARARAVASGKAVGVGRVPLGYLRGDDGRLVLDPQAAGLVQEMFKLRARGGTIADCQRLLAGEGHVRAYNAIKDMLSNRIYLGEIRHGSFENLAAHDPVVTPETFQQAQRTQVAPRGRKPSTERLLSKLGILRCGSCDRALVCDSFSSDGRPRYRCTAHGIECARKVSIVAKVVEDLVITELKKAYPDARGTASGDIDAADKRVETTQAALDGAIAAFAVLGSEPSAVARLKQLKDERDAAIGARDRLAGTVTVSLSDWEDFTMSEKRSILQRAVEYVRVAPGIPGRAGRGLDARRLTIKFR